jgi:hypothetical protein
MHVVAAESNDVQCGHTEAEGGGDSGDKLIRDLLDPNLSAQHRTQPRDLPQLAHLTLGIAASTTAPL